MYTSYSIYLWTASDKTQWNIYTFFFFSGWLLKNLELIIVVAGFMFTLICGGRERGGKFPTSHYFRSEGGAPTPLEIITPAISYVYLHKMQRFLRYLWKIWVEWGGEHFPAPTPLQKLKHEPWVVDSCCCEPLYSYNYSNFLCINIIFGGWVTIETETKIFSNIINLN